MAHPHVVDLPPRKQPAKKLPVEPVWIIGAVLVLLVIIFFLVPAFKGYGMYKAVKAAGISEDVVAELKAMEDEKQAAERRALETSEDAQRRVADAESAYNATSAKAALLESDLASCLESEVVKESFRQELEQSYRRDIARVQKDLRVCEEDSDDLVENVAARICCVQQVYNDKIAGYDIRNNDVVCLEEGGTALEC